VLAVGETLGAIVVAVGETIGAIVVAVGDAEGSKVGMLLGELGAAEGLEHTPQALGQRVLLLGREQSRSKSALASFARTTSALQTSSSSFSKHGVGEAVGALVVGESVGTVMGLPVGENVGQ
jgi:hypothetical protein